MQMLTLNVRLWKRSGGGNYQWKVGFGPWEQIFYGEFGSVNVKNVLVKIIGE